MSRTVRDIAVAALVGATVTATLGGAYIANADTPPVQPVQVCEADSTPLGCLLGVPPTEPLVDPDWRDLVMPEALR